MAQTYYPVALDLARKRCLVVGGGTIATDKVEGLLAAEAQVEVVSPDVGERIEELAAAGLIQLHRRAYQPSDVAGAFLAIGATDDLRVNAEVASDARAAGILVNAVDDPPNCDFFAVAIVRRGDLQLGISTGGRSPAFARWMREHLDASLPAEYADLLAVLGEVRDGLKARGPIPPYERWQAAITEEVLDQLRRGDRAAARSQIDRAVSGVSQGAGRPVAAGRVEL
jgi:precorrin-2 dehydrogenase/sirohydrochlorin ferrochelatase